MSQKSEILVVTSRRQGLLAGILGVVLSIGLIDTLLLGRPYLFEILFGTSSQFFTNMSAESGIAVEKLLLLDYFLFLPWPVINRHRIDYIVEIGYPQGLERSSTPFLIIFHSLYFFLGALLTITLSGREKRPLEEDLRWKPWKGVIRPPWLSFTLQGHPPPWVLYTLLMVGAHLLLMGAAATYYTGPGGPTWVYPSPLLVIPFIMGISLISFIAQNVYTWLSQMVGSK